MILIVETEHRDVKVELIPQLVRDDVNNDEGSQIIKYSVGPTAEDPTKSNFVKEYPTVTASQESSLSVSLISHKAIARNSHVNLDLETAIVTELGTNSSDKTVIAAFNLSDQPLCNFELDQDILEGYETLLVVRPDRFKPQELSLIGYDKESIVINSVQGFPSKLTKDKFENGMSCIDRETECTNLYGNKIFYRSGIAIEVCSRDGLLCIVKYYLSIEKPQIIDIPGVKITDNSSLKHTAAFNSANQSVLVVLSAAGDLIVVQFDKSQNYSHAKLDGGLNYHTVFFVPETQHIQILGTSGSDATILSVKYTGEELEKPTTAVKTGIPEPISENIRLGSIPVGDQQVFVLILPNGQLYSVEKGTARKAGILCNTEFVQVTEVVRFVRRDTVAQAKKKSKQITEDKKNEVSFTSGLQVLISSNNSGKESVLTVAKILLK